LSNDSGDERSLILERIAQFRSEDADVPPIWQAKRELATSVRALLDCICVTDAAESELRDAAAEVRGMAERFVKEPFMTDPLGIAEMALSGMETFHDRSPLVGRSNPIAPPLDLAPDAESGLVKGTGFFGNAYEGAPGCVHGGFLAAAFDELLGMACIFSGNPGMTGTLEIRYRSPTPVRTELRFEGRLDRVEGRRIYTSGAVYSGDVCCAESTGIFVSIDRKKFEDLNQSRRERLDADAGRS
jgi:acyl-coenzyme A thioesterase PaaI-like protein